MYARLFEIILILLEEKKVSATFLSEKFSVSRRTICRDMQVFLSSSIPVLSDQGRTGGLYLKEEYSQYYDSLSKEKKIFVIATLNGLRDYKYDTLEDALNALQVFFDLFLKI